MQRVSVVTGAAHPQHAGGDDMTDPTGRSGSEHTPGPWTIDSETSELEGGGYVLGLVYGGEDYPCEAETPEQLKTCQANARLIAAAPDILEALKDAPEPPEVSGLRAMDYPRLVAEWFSYKYFPWLKARDAAIAKVCR
jgi:hypothetical protein